jgi:uncharacterized protein YndB with AHSA1/START domain
MPDILLETMIKASPEKIYKALTEQSGLASWWTTDTLAQPKVGTVSEFKFYGGKGHFKIRVNELEPGKKVYWAPLQGPPDWTGTRITWDLTPVEGGTKVVFGHRDYESVEGSFPSVGYQWAGYFISLKAYLESGKGTPHPDEKF